MNDEEQQEQNEFRAHIQPPYSPVDLTHDEADSLTTILRTTPEVFDEPTRESARNLLKEYYEYHHMTPTGVPKDLDEQMLAALGGDPEAAAAIADSAYKGVFRRGMSAGIGFRDLLVGAAKTGLLFSNAILEDPTDGSVDPTKANVQAAINSLDNWYAERKAKDIDYMKEHFDNADVSGFEYFAGGAVPTMMFTPGGPLFATPKTFSSALAWMMGEAGLTGGAFQALEAETFDQLISPITLSMLTAGAGMTFFHTIPGMKAYAGRKLRDIAETEIGKSAMALEKEVQRITGDETFGFTVAQIAKDNPYMIGLERGAAGALTLRTQNERISTLANFIERRSSQGATPAEILDDLHETLLDISKTARDKASDNYGLMLSKLADDYGDDLIINHRNAQEHLSDAKEYLYNRYQDPKAMNAANPVALHRVIAYMEPKVNPFSVVVKTDSKGNKFFQVDDVRGREKPKVFNTPEAAAQYRELMNEKYGGLSTTDVAEMLKGHGSLVSGTSQGFDNAAVGSNAEMGKYMISSLLTRLEADVQTPAVKALNDVRKAYEYEMLMHDQIKNLAISKVLGDNYDEMFWSHPEQAWQQISRLDYSQYEKVRDLLLTNGRADLLYSMRKQMFREILADSRDPRLPDNIDLHRIDMLIDALSQRTTKAGTSPVGARGMGLFSEVEQAEVIAAAQAARKLAVTYRADYARDTKGEIGDASINAISRSVEFMTRYLTRAVLQGKTLENFLVDPAARNALITLANEGLDTSKTRAAVFFLASAASHDMFSESIRKNAEMKRAEQENRYNRAIQ